MWIAVCLKAAWRTDVPLRLQEDGNPHGLSLLRKGSSPIARGSRIRLQKSVLIVDDNPDFLALVSYMLTQSGYQVLAADSSVKALEFLELNVPDALVLDLMMPVRTGFEVLENIRWEARFANMPVVVLSAMNLNPLEREFIEALSVEYLDKARTSELTDVLRALLPED